MQPAIGYAPCSFPPAIGICGRSGSGKTLLIQQLVPRLTARGLRVSVVKHCTHRLEADRPGKDTDRIFQAGADVLAAGASEAFARYHETAMPLSHAMARVAQGADLCLVEGFRDQGLPRIQVLYPDDPEPLAGDSNLLMVVRGLANGAALESCCAGQAGQVGCPALNEAERVVIDCLNRAHAALPAMALILVGGQSRRMGRPKSLLEINGRCVLDRLVSAVSPYVSRIMLSGAGPVPEAFANLDRLPDVPGAQGPLAGILSAMRWQPFVRWIVLACDLPLIDPAAVQWLLNQTRPGLDAVCPRLQEDSPGEPLFAVFEPPCRFRFEDTVLKISSPSGIIPTQAEAGAWSLRHILHGDRILKPLVPESLRPAWTNVNTPTEWQAALKLLS